MAIEGADIVKAAAFLGAGIAMGLGAIGPGGGEGYAAGKACEEIQSDDKFKAQAASSPQCLGRSI